MEIKLDNILDNSCSFPIKRDYNRSKVIFIDKTLYLDLENIDNECIYDVINTSRFLHIYCNDLYVSDNEIENNRFWLLKFIYKAAPWDDKYFYIRNAFYFIHYRKVMDYIFSRVNISNNIADELVSVIKKYHSMDILYEWIRNYYDGIISYSNMGPSQYQGRIFRDKKITIILDILKDKYIHRTNMDFYIDIDFYNHSERNEMYKNMKTFLYTTMVYTRDKLFTDMQKDNNQVNNWKLDRILKENSTIRNIYEINEIF